MKTIIRRKVRNIKFEYLFIYTIKLYKTGTIVQYTTAGGKVRMGEYIKDTPSGKAVVMVDGRKTLPPKTLLKRVKKKEEPKKAKRMLRIDIYDKSGNTIKRIDNIPDDAKILYDKIKSWVEDKGYVFTKDQLYRLNEGLVDYIINNTYYFGVDIKPSKGKTDMMIISVSGHGSGIASIRVKKKGK